MDPPKSTAKFGKKCLESQFQVLSLTGATAQMLFTINAPFTDISIHISP